MMNEYKGIINNSIINSYNEILVIDVMEDKLYKYLVKAGNISFSEEISYMKYLNDCKEFIYEDDIDSYIDSLSISKLENESNGISLNYKRKDNTLNSYLEYMNTISLCDNNGKKIIVVLVSSVNNGKRYALHNDGVKSHLETKLNQMVDSVSLAILKIHNIINNDSNIYSKEEFINSILVSLTNEFPEFNEALNDNAMFLTEGNKSTVMIIDDDKMTCNLIKKIFEKKYDVILAHNGNEAIELLKNSGNMNISCIFLDLIMPDLDGFSVLDYLNDNNYLSKMPVIIISGNYDKETRNRAYSYKIADMLEKPFNVQVVRHRIENLINLYRSSNSLGDILSQQHRDLKNIVNSLVHSYEMDNAKCMEMLRKYTRILAMQVSVQYPEYNINSNMIDKIANSSVYYAIGNWTMPKSLLYKKGLFTEDERSIMNMANINGANIVKYVISRDNHDIDSNYCYDIVKSCNERYDGNGYPQGLSANSIPIATQIASLAIEYVNLVNTIVPIDYDKVASLIVMESGRKFNPKIVDSFKKVQSEFEAITKVGS
ncbi:MAG: response regulator [Bacilli bacterium]|nr:response regulator [Bacilli bacterium]